MIASNGADQSSGIGFAIPDQHGKGCSGRPDALRTSEAAVAGHRVVWDWAGPGFADGPFGRCGRADSAVIPGGAAERAGLHGGNEQAYVGNMPNLAGRRPDCGNRRTGSDRSFRTSARSWTSTSRRHCLRDNFPRTEADDAEAAAGRSAGRKLGPRVWVRGGSGADVLRSRLAEWAAEEAFDALGEHGGAGESLPALQDAAVGGEEECSGD
jgi:hypothetical protein